METKERLSIKRVLNSLIDDLEKQIKAIWVSKGVPKNSDLIKSVEVVNNRNVLTVYASDYYEYLNSGRKKYTKKIPISALLYWIRHYKIRPKGGITVNQLAYIFQNAIYHNGIKGRKFLSQTDKTITKIMQKELEKFYVVEIEKGILQVIKNKTKK